MSQYSAYREVWVSEDSDGRPLRSAIDKARLRDQEMVIRYVPADDTELANLRSLLRSVTRRLENAREILDGKCEARNMFAAAAELDAVLEALS